MRLCFFCHLRQELSYTYSFNPLLLGSDLLLSVSIELLELQMIPFPHGPPGCLQLKLILFNVEHSIHVPIFSDARKNSMAILFTFRVRLVLPRQASIRGIVSPKKNHYAHSDTNTYRHTDIQSENMFTRLKYIHVRTYIYTYIHHFETFTESQLLWRWVSSYSLRLKEY